MNQIPYSPLTSVQSMTSCGVCSTNSGIENTTGSASLSGKTPALRPGINPYAVLRPLPISTPLISPPTIEANQSQSLALTLDSYTNQISQLFKLMQDTMQKLMENFITAITRVLSSMGKGEANPSSSIGAINDSVQAETFSPPSASIPGIPTGQNIPLSPTTTSTTIPPTLGTSGPTPTADSTGGFSSFFKDSVAKVEGFFDQLLSMKEDIKRIFKKGGKVVDLFKKVGGEALDLLVSKTPIGKLAKGASSVFKKITKLF